MGPVKWPPLPGGLGPKAREASARIARRQLVIREALLKRLQPGEAKVSGVTMSVEALLSSVPSSRFGRVMGAYLREIGSGRATSLLPMLVTGGALLLYSELSELA